MKKISKLYIELSSLCNLSCKMCFRNNWFDERPSLMSGDTCKALINILTDDVAETAFFGGMGEPLMHTEIFNMISVANKSGMKTELITNATMLNENVSEKLISSGLNTLWISMDGFSKQSYEGVRLGSVYETIVGNINSFNKLRKSTKLGITFVLMSDNLYELDRINEFADAHDVDFINLSHVVPNASLPEEKAIYNLDYKTGKMHRFDKNEKCIKEVDVCPFISEEVSFIRSDGEVCPCMQLLHNSYTYLYTEKRKVHSYSFGNINEFSFEKIYNSDDYFAFRERVKSFEFPCCTICMGCDDRKGNLTDCMYNCKPTCGACLWAQGGIRCP